MLEGTLAIMCVIGVVLLVVVVAVLLGEGKEHPTASQGLATLIGLIIIGIAVLGYLLKYLIDCLVK